MYHYISEKIAKIAIKCQIREAYIIINLGKLETDWSLV